MARGRGDPMAKGRRRLQRLGCHWPCSGPACDAVVGKRLTERLAERDSCGTWSGLGASSEVDRGGVGEIEEERRP